LKYLLILLIFTASPNGGAQAPTVPIVAEFNTLEACWAANSAIIDPFRRDDQWQITTSSRCVAKGQDPFGQ
jgi:hypothetical protein